MAQDVDDDAIEILGEESSNPPRFVSERMQDLDSSANRFA